MRGVSVFFVLFALRFHNRLGLISEPSFYWVFYFYFPSLSLFVSSYVKMKKACLFWFKRLAISWPPWVRVWGWDSYRFKPFTVFALGLFNFRLLLFSRFFFFFLNFVVVVVVVVVVARICFVFELGQGYLFVVQ